MTDTHLVQIQLDAPNAVTSIDSTSMIDEATELVIDSPMMAELAGEMLISAKVLYDVAEAERKLMVKPINEAHGNVQSFFKRHTDPLERVIAILKPKIIAYNTEMQRKAAEKQRIVDEAATKERSRLLQEGMATAARADQAANKLRDEAAAAAAAGDAVRAAQLSAKADSKEEAGAVQAAELQMAAASTVAVIVAADTTKVAGISAMKSNWKFQIDDESKIPREFLCPDEKKLGAYAKAMKESAKVDGIRFFNDPSIAIRAKV